MWFGFPTVLSNIYYELLGEDYEDLKDFVEYVIEEYEAPFKVASNMTIDDFLDISCLYEENADNEVVEYLDFLVEKNVFDSIEHAFENIDGLIVHKSSLDDIAYKIVTEVYNIEGLALMFFDFDEFIKHLEMNYKYIACDYNLTIEIQCF